MSIPYIVSKPLKAREKVAFEEHSLKGSSRVDKILERGCEIDFNNDETNAFCALTGQLKASRTAYFQDHRQVSLLTYKLN